MLQLVRRFALDRVGAVCIGLEHVFDVDHLSHQGLIVFLIDELRATAPSALRDSLLQILDAVHEEFYLVYTVIV